MSVNQERTVHFSPSLESMRALISRCRAQTEEEKGRWAREIHDGLSQNISELSMRVWFLDDALREISPDTAQLRQMTRELLPLVENIVTATVSLEAKLAPRIKELGFIAAIEMLAHQWQQQTGIAARIAVTGREGSFQPQRALELYRVVEEILQNTVRHANASQVEIAMQFSVSPRMLKLEISDDGIGLDSVQWQSEKSLGLLQIRERLAALGGEAVLVNVGKGTAMRLTLPWPAATGELSSRDITETNLNVV